MTQDQPEYRLSDAEREDAIEVLGEHMSNGRLDVEEYGERTAQVAAATFRRDLAEIFHDLPEPRPAVLREPAPVIRQGMALERLPQRDLGERLAPLLVPAAAVLALVLFFVTRQWLVFLLPAIAAVLAGMSMGRGYR